MKFFEQNGGEAFSDDEELVAWGENQQDLDRKESKNEEVGMYKNVGENGLYKSQSEVLHQSLDI